MVTALRAHLRKLLLITRKREQKGGKNNRGTSDVDRSIPEARRREENSEEIHLNIHSVCWHVHKYCETLAS